MMQRTLACSRLLIVTLCFIAGITGSRACVCHWPSDYTNHELDLDMLNDASVIVSGSVIQTTESFGGSFMKQEVTFDVIEVFKNFSDSVITIMNWYPGCEEYELGGEYLLFLTIGPEDRFQLAYCYGRIPLHPAEEHWKKNTAELLRQAREFKVQADGPSPVKYSSGVSIASGKWLNGVPTGPWQLFTYDGQLGYTGEYVQGKKEGVWKKYVYAEGYIFEDSWDGGKLPLLEILVARFENGVQLTEWSKEP